MQVERLCPACVLNAAIAETPADTLFLVDSSWINSVIQPNKLTSNDNSAAFLNILICNW